MDGQIKEGRASLKQLHDLRKSLVAQKTAVITAAKENDEAALKAKLAEMPTSPNKVDWQQSKEVNLPKIDIPPVEQPTTQQRRKAQFMTGFDQTQGMPRIMTVDLTKGRSSDAPTIPKG